MEEKDYKEIKVQLDFYMDKYKFTDSLYHGVKSLIAENKELKEKIENFEKENKKSLDNIIEKDKP